MRNTNERRSHLGVLGAKVAIGKLRVGVQEGLTRAARVGDAHARGHAQHTTCYKGADHGTVQLLRGHKRLAPIDALQQLFAHVLTKKRKKEIHLI